MTFRSTDGNTNLSNADLIALDLAIAAAQKGGPATPPPDPLIAHLPSGMFHSPPPQTRKYDFVRQSKMKPRAVPWTLPYVSPGVLANSTNGQKPLRIYDYHLFGPRTYLYSQLQHFSGGRSDPVNKEFGDDLAQIVLWETKYPNVFGARGICRPDPYCSVVSHPHAYLPPDPRAGQQIPRAPFLSIFWHNRQVGLAYADGSVVDCGKIPGTKPLYKVVTDKSNRLTLYAAELASGIVRIDRTAGKGTAASQEDATKYTTTLAWVARWPTDVDTHTDGSVYYCDNGDVYKDGALWQRMGAADAIVVDSPRNRVAVLTTDMVLSVFDMAGALTFRVVVEPGMSPTARNIDFFTIDVDENGTIGPAGTFYCSRVHTIGNSNLWQISADGSSLKFDHAIFGTSPGGWNVCGPLKDVQQWWGHYGGWVLHIHRYQGVMLSNGYGDTLLSVKVFDPPLPASGSIPYMLVWSGMSALAEAGLTSVVSSQGESPYLGCSYDELAELSFDDCYAAIQRGLITETPRPELAGIPGIRAVGAIAANSQRAMREGKPFLDAYLSWASAKGLGTNYGTVLNGGHFTQQYPTYYETDGNTIVATDQGRSTPIRYTWPPVNVVQVSTAGQSIVNDNGVVYCTPGPTRARVS